MQRRLTEGALSQQPSTSHSCTYLDPSLLLLAAPLPEGISVVVIEGRKCINLFTSSKFKISHLGRRFKHSLSGHRATSKIEVIKPAPTGHAGSCLTFNVTFSNIKVGLCNFLWTVSDHNRIMANAKTSSNRRISGEKLWSQQTESEMSVQQYLHTAKYDKVG